jgi:hypothetical protein
MPAQLNHTIVWCRDKKRSSEFLVRILGCSPAVRFYHFMVVHLANNVSLDFMEKGGPISRNHGLTRSTITTAAAAYISTIPMATCSRSSRVPMGADENLVTDRPTEKTAIADPQNLR